MPTSWAVPPLSFPLTRLEQCLGVRQVSGVSCRHPHVLAILYDDDKKGEHLPGWVREKAEGGVGEEGRADPLMPAGALVLAV